MREVARSSLLNPARHRRCTRSSSSPPPDQLSPAARRRSRRAEKQRARRSSPAAIRPPESWGPSRRVLIATAITGFRPCPGQVGVLDGAVCKRPAEAQQTHGAAAQPGCATPPAATYPAYRGCSSRLAPTAWEAAGLGVVRPCSGGCNGCNPPAHEEPVPYTTKKISLPYVVYKVLTNPIA